jgi:hypothetical protein
MYGTTYVYLFAVFYGLPYVCFAKRPKNLPQPAALSYQN